MKKSEFIEEFANIHEDSEILRMDGLDEACIGWSDSWNGNERPMRLVYDANKIIEILMDEGMDEEEAVEFYEFNIAGAFMGDNQPIIINSWLDTF